jgi:hypothetical protein
MKDGIKQECKELDRRCYVRYLRAKILHQVRTPIIRQYCYYYSDATVVISVIWLTISDSYYYGIMQ